MRKNTNIRLRFWSINHELAHFRLRKAIPWKGTEEREWRQLEKLDRENKKRHGGRKPNSGLGAKVNIPKEVREVEKSLEETYANPCKRHAAAVRIIANRHHVSTNTIYVLLRKAEEKTPAEQVNGAEPPAPSRWLRFFGRVLNRKWALIFITSLATSSAMHSIATSCPRDDIVIIDVKHNGSSQKPKGVTRMTTIAGVP